MKQNINAVLTDQTRVLWLKCAIHVCAEDALCVLHRGLVCGGHVRRSDPQPPQPVMTEETELKNVSM